MSWGFEVGKVYDRRADIHARYGGQQQGGIITPSQHSLIVIITGEEGLTHGYADRAREDGVFEYFGEGQLGDMTMQRGNLAIASHSAEGKSLLLFQKEAVCDLRARCSMKLTTSRLLQTEKVLREKRSFSNFARSMR